MTESVSKQKVPEICFIYFYGAAPAIPRKLHKPAIFAWALACWYCMQNGDRGMGGTVRQTRPVPVTSVHLRHASERAAVQRVGGQEGDP